MRVQRNKSNHARLCRYEFSWQKPRNVLRVEVTDSKVVVYAANNNFLPGQQAAFARYLMEEGFISEQFCKGVGSGVGSSPVEWMIGHGQPATESKRRRARLDADSFFLWLLGGAVVAWLVGILTLLLTAKR